MSWQPGLFKFHPGSIVATQGALALGINFIPYLLRHVSADWGDELDFGDKQANDAALVEGERLLSKYRVTPDQCIYIITEWDRSYTTILLPEEY